VNVSLDVYAHMELDRGSNSACWPTQARDDLSAKGGCFAMLVLTQRAPFSVQLFFFASNRGFRIGRRKRWQTSRPDAANVAAHRNRAIRHHGDSKVAQTNADLARLVHQAKVQLLVRAAAQ
jgi:hypothetical protein